MTLTPEEQERAEQEYTPDVPGCVWVLHDYSECGDDAYQMRDGLPFCPKHTNMHDALTNY